MAKEILLNSRLIFGSFFLLLLLLFLVLSWVYVEEIGWVIYYPQLRKTHKKKTRAEEKRKKNHKNIKIQDEKKILWRRFLLLFFFCSPETQVCLKKANKVKCIFNLLGGLFLCLVNKITQQEHNNFFNKLCNIRF